MVSSIRRSPRGAWRRWSLDITKIANDLIDAFIDAGRCELVETFCGPLPMIVIADQLGVPRDDLALFNKWSDAFVAQLSRMASPDEELEAAKLIVQYQHYFAKKLEERKLDRRDDIISDIVHARLEGERPLDTAESLSIIQQLLVAGNETTTSAIAEGILLLIKHPDQLTKLQADPGLIPNLVEEVLRLSTPTANMWRVCKADTEVNGTKIPAGSMIQIRYSSADRDETVFEHAEAFDVTRKQRAAECRVRLWRAHVYRRKSRPQGNGGRLPGIAFAHRERRARLRRGRAGLSAECVVARTRDATDPVHVALNVCLNGRLTRRRPDTVRFLRRTAGDRAPCLPGKSASLVRR